MIIFNRCGLEIFYEFDSLQEKRIIQKTLSVLTEGYWYSQAYQDKRWDGYYKFYDKKRRCFYYGLLKTVTDALDRDEYEYKFKKNKKQKFKLNPKQLEFSTDREYQIEAVKHFLQAKEGILKIFTQLGKTYIFAELVKNFLKVYPDFKTIFICDTQDIYNQVIDVLKKHVGLSDEDIGRINSGVVRDGKVVISSVQTVDSILHRKSKTKTGRSLKRENKKKVLDIFKKTNFLVVDECHEFGTDKRIDILKKIKNTEYRLFLSATPFKTGKGYNIQNWKIRSVAGEIFYEIDEKKGVDLGYLKKNKVILFLIDHSKNQNLQQGDYRYLINEVIVNNNERNSILTSTIEILRKAKLKTIVLFFYESHIKKISEITGDTYVSGKTDVKVRKNIKQSFVKGKGKILLASSIYNKGTSLPQAQVIVNAAGGKEETNVIQKKGRVLGISDGKDTKALIIDFIDVFDYFSEHSDKRVKSYIENSGEENITVLDTTSNEFYSDFRDILESWF